VVGNFDPPASVSGEDPGSGTNGAFNVHDVNRDKFVTSLDVLALVNLLNTHGSGIAGNDPRIPAGYHCDVNGDGQVTPLDPLAVINYLNLQLASAEGEAVARAGSDDLLAEGESALADAVLNGVPSALDALTTLRLDVVASNADEDAAASARSAHDGWFAALAQNASDDRRQSPEAATATDGTAESVVTSKTAAAADLLEELSGEPAIAALAAAPAAASPHDVDEVIRRLFG
jgi:hypothetical protein